MSPPSADLGGRRGDEGRGRGSRGWREEGTSSDQSKTSSGGALCGPPSDLEAARSATAAERKKSITRFVTIL